MAKILILVVIAAIIEATGVVILSGGLKHIQGARTITVSEVARVIKDGCTNGKVLLGTALEAVFYGILLYMLACCDVSFLWPLTSLGFIITTLAARVLLNEQVSWVRWGGVMLIAAGVCLISYSESVKQKAAAGTPVVTAPGVRSGGAGG